MITISRPGGQPIEIEFVLIDFDGSLAVDRRVNPKAKDRLNLLSKRTQIYIFATGDRDRVSEALKKVKAEIIYVKEGESSLEKLNLLQKLGPERSVAIGNGIDDLRMIEAAGFGIAVLSREGAAGQVLSKADLVVKDILDALDFLLKPLRQRATLTA